MKLSEVFNVTAKDLGIKYYQSSFDGGSAASDGKDDDFRAIVNIPSHVNIDPTTEVTLVKNNRTIHNASWEDMINWIRNNFDNMSGTYRILYQDQELHSFRIA